jgi:3-oxo-5-alpha-steroid 4-dehydrogenase 1
MDRALFNNFLWLWTIVGFLTFILLLFVTAPYGRHSRKDWGPSIPNKVAWIVMEAPSLIIFILSFLLGPNGIQPVTWIFFAIYVFHYGNRSILWPLRTNTSGKQMPLVIAFLAIVFNLANGFSNGYYFSAFAREYTWEWLFDIRFILGFIV